MVLNALTRDQVQFDERTGTPKRPDDPVVLSGMDDVAALTFEEFDRAIPNPDMLKDFEDGPHLYWEPVAPGIEMKYLPRVPSFHSSADGLWYARNLYQEILVRKRLADYTGGNPDLLRVDMKEYRQAEKEPDRWLQCQNCPVRSTSVHAIKLHTRHWKHTIA